MSSETYGYSSQVGEWSGSVDLANGEQQPITAITSVLDRLKPSMEKLHRPAQLLVSWGEYALDGEELAFHELEKFPVVEWDAITEQLARLQTSTTAVFAVGSLFVELDTTVIEPHGQVNKPGSAELQVSIDTPLQPSLIELRYATFIDVWLSTTYDELYRPRANRQAAGANRPRLEAVLNAIRSLTGSSFKVGQSQLYQFAITETGFRDVDDLPRREAGNLLTS